ncbi:MAG: His/Gly/Thr/Pro-type tRNA ligase C-terminal domain-containing protein, partial [Acidobacteriota bacterium]|nr:His/Gly/Thr/Pro-type tRNA ligase C-terminal domain-containing protein [Acidobacteriota bacterium]
VAAARELAETLGGNGIAVRVDDRDNVNPGFKYAEWELKGVPLRLELGPRDLDADQVVAVSRIDRSKTPVSRGEAPASVAELLEKIQRDLLAAARDRREAATRTVETWDEFREAIEAGGFLKARFAGNAEDEDRIQKETKATVRVVPLEGAGEKGPCVLTGKTTDRWVYFARAY